MPHFPTPRTSLPKPAHLPAKTTQTAAKTLPSAPIQPHDPPHALLELAEMRGNEREIDLSVLSPRNYKWVRVRRKERLLTDCYCCRLARSRFSGDDRAGLWITE